MNSSCSGVSLSVLISNWNTRDLVIDLLRSIEQHPPKISFEVIVVDNGSEDGSGSCIETFFPSVILAGNKSNTGFARANNQAFATSKGDFVLLLQSDTLILDNSIQVMFDYLSSHPSVGAVSCRLLNPDKSVQHSCRRFSTPWDGMVTYMSFHMLATRYRMATFDSLRTQEVGQPSATCMMIRRTVLDQLGFFDERHSILYNDVDLCKGIRPAGGRLCISGLPKLCTMKAPVHGKHHRKPVLRCIVTF